MLWFNKSRRAQSADDYETWLEGGVVPTLNAFDNGDVRATTVIVVRMREGKPGGGKGPLMSEDRSLTLATANDQTLFVFYGNRVDDVRIQDGKINTLQARMGTGGNNMPMVATTGWTEGQSDTHRYKQMGNAVAVPVVEWIISGIVDTLKDS
jgi:site-specific DNA-cytosine methylase